MIRFTAILLWLLSAVCSAMAAGTIPIALAQSVDVNGRPLAGALLYIYQTGTVATQQNAFFDTALTQPMAWPLQADQNGRLPMFYLADGAVHVRLTDSLGVVQFDYPSMLVIGPSSGSGGSNAVDPSSIASTGDVKFRPTGDTLTGWVKLNGQTIGNVTSGGTGRANADTQALFIYLWGVCDDAHCPVSSGRGVSGLADFNASKTITLPDLRSRSPFGLDDMGASAAGRLLSSNVTSGGGDGVTTPFATGGEANHTVSQAELPAISPGITITDPGHTHTLNNATNVVRNIGGSTGGGSGFSTSTITENSATTGITAAFTSPLGSGTAGNNMGPFMLGSWYQKL